MVLKSQCRGRELLLLFGKRVLLVICISSPLPLAPCPLPLPPSLFPLPLPSRKNRGEIGLIYGRSLPQ